MLGIAVGWVTADVVEWTFHKYIQHGFGRHKTSFWSFHWREHHKTVRKHNFHDPVYLESIWANNAHAKEFWSITAAVTAISPAAIVAPFFVGTLAFRAVKYYKTHKRCHLDPQWGMEHVPWHYDHHMGPKPNSNWCVTHSWLDKVLQSHEPWLGTVAQQKLEQAVLSSRTLRAW